LAELLKLIAIFLIIIALFLLIHTLIRWHFPSTKKAGWPFLIILSCLVFIKILFLTLARTHWVDTWEIFSPQNLAFRSLDSLTTSPADLF